MKKEKDKRSKILVVDDEFYVRKMLEKILIEYGYEIFCVSSGEAAVRSVKDEQYDLVLLDLKLKGMDGIATLERIRNVDNNIPIILISGYLTMEKIEKACKYGIFSYIRKPFKVEDLKHKVKRAVG